MKVTNPKLDHKMNLFVFNLMFVGANNWRPKICMASKSTREADEKGLKRENEETLFFLIISILFTNP